MPFLDRFWGLNRVIAVAIRRATLLVVAAGLCTLAHAAAPAAAAAATTPNFTWDGADVGTSSPAWSDRLNWAGNVAPAANAALGTVSFPQLTRSGCTSSPHMGACYTSADDRRGLTIQRLVIDDTDPYHLTPASSASSITLAAGLTTTAGGNSGAAMVSVPIRLGAAQTWNLTSAGNGSGGLTLSAPLSGLQPLNATMAHGDALTLKGNNEVGNTSFTGADPTQGCSNGQLSLNGSLNAGDRKPSTFREVSLSVIRGAMGPLAMSGACLDVGRVAVTPAGQLTSTVVAFDSTSRIQFNIAGSGTTPAVDYSQLAATGAVNLGGAQLELESSGTNGCITPPIGQKYTLVSTTGMLTGRFGNVANGGIIKDGCNQQNYQVVYATTGSVETVTAVAVPNVTTTSLSASPAAAATDEQVKLLAAITSSSQSPSGTVAFDAAGAPIPGCEARPVTAVGPDYFASCATAFAASASPLQLTATFYPDAQSGEQGSQGVTTMTVAPSWTVVSLTASTTRPTTGALVTYAAAVTPGYWGSVNPTGAVTFLDGGTPIAGCTSLVLQPALPPSAFCTVAYSAARTHAVTAQYGGDANFDRAGSDAITITVSTETSSSTTPAPGGGFPTGPAPRFGPPAEQLLVGLGRVRGTILRVRLRCLGPAGGTCTATALLTRSGGARLVLGRRRTTIAGGISQLFAVRLNRTGRRLLARRRIVRVNLAVIVGSRVLARRRLVFRSAAPVR